MFQPNSKKVIYEERFTQFDEQNKFVNRVIPHQIETDLNIPKLGLMIVGWGGNNGSTLTAGILANKTNTAWVTKQGIQSPNYYGSFTQSSTTKVGVKYQDGKLSDVFQPIKHLVPLVNPSDILITGWDISDLNLYDSCIRAQVLEPSLLDQLKEQLSDMQPMPAAFEPQFIASNQMDRANNILRGSNQEVVDVLRQNIRDFKSKVDKVIILWTANTEETVEDIKNLEVLNRYIQKNHKLQASVLYAYSALMEGVTFLNGSPQNTLHPAILELAEKQKACVGGSDFKSGQTRFKTVMGDFLNGSGIKMKSIVSYNHLGNNDGKNLSESHTFKSKEISKSGCLDDQINSNKILYPEGNDLDHVVVIKYVPFVQDSKRAMDEYSSKIFMNGINTITSYNVCEDSLLAVPLMIDMVLLAEFFERVQINGEKMGPVLSYLSFFFKAPITNRNEYVINSFTRQREMLCNFLKATQGYTIEDNTLIHLKY